MKRAITPAKKNKILKYRPRKRGGRAVTPCVMLMRLYHRDWARVSSNLNDKPHREYDHNMSTAQFRFHGRLNDFLKPQQREQPITVHFRERQTVKHLAESLGVPHPEIGRIQVKGREEAILERLEPLSKQYFDEYHLCPACQQILEGFALQPDEGKGQPN